MLLLSLRILPGIRTHSCCRSDVTSHIIICKLRSEIVWFILLSITTLTRIIKPLWLGNWFIGIIIISINYSLNVYDFISFTLEIKILVIICACLCVMSQIQGWLLSSLLFFRFCGILWLAWN